VDGKVSKKADVNVYADECLRILREDRGLAERLRLEELGGKV